MVQLKLYTELYCLYAFLSLIIVVTLRFRGTNRIVKVLGENWPNTYIIMIWNKHETNVLTIHLL